MYPVSELYLKVIRNWRAVTCKATHYDPFTGTETPLPIEDGTVTVDSTAACRRTLSLTVSPTADLWQALAAPGGEITVTQTTRYIDQSTETVPLGVFVVDQDTLDYTTGGDLVITARDRWVVVQRNRFGAADALRATIPANATWQEVKRLVEGAWPNAAAYPFPGWAILDQSATSKVGPQLWSDGSRENAITTLADSRWQVFFDPTGKAVLRRTPVLTASSTPVWTVDAGGVQITADRTRDRTRTRNAVIVTTSSTSVYLTPVVVANTNPADPLSTKGPLGFVPWYLSSPTFTDPVQMRAAGVTALSKQLGVAQQLSLTNSPNGALDADDVIGVLLPGADDPEVHIIDTVTVPLLPTGTQSIQTRSTRPTADDSGGS